mmetsp:Transcript_24320/g.36415  ORF Transcript_24320/g.36415 Transcript_24320/m.36415 type:complete len:255 (+) Transcript_24320:1916-2680(+)
MLLNQRQHSTQILTATSLIPERHSDNARMILITQHIIQHTPMHGRPPRRIIHKPPHRLYPMRLNIRLVHHIESKQICQTVKTHVGRVVTAPNRIKIILLQHTTVLNHLIDAHHLAFIRTVLMPINTTNDDFGTIDGQIWRWVIIQMLHLDRAKANACTLHLNWCCRNIIITAVIQGNNKCVQIRHLSGPLLYTANGILHQYGNCCIITRRGQHDVLSGAGPDALPSLHTTVQRRLNIAKHFTLYRTLHTTTTTT